MSKEESDMAPDVMIGPGMQLRKARERRGLDQAIMASQLHLSQTMIAALEADDFDNLPGPVFVQGYLRKYARLLGVNEDVVVEAYQNLLPVSHKLPIKGAPKQALGAEFYSGYHIMRYVTWGILLILAALVFFWWQSRVELGAPVSMPAQEQEEMGARNLIIDQIVQPPVVVKEDLSQPASPPPSLVEESEQVLSTDDEVLSNSDQLLPSPDERSRQPAAMEETAPLSTQSQVIAQPRESALDEVADKLSKQVLFQFSEPCWIEVRDQAGKLRIFGEMASGMERILDSRLGPFNILLGNAPGVKLTIDGEVFDLKPFIRGKVARFTLDPQRL